MTRPAGVGDYRWIGDAAAFATLVDELGSCDVYGLDTEFHREKTYFPHLALLQISWEGGIALVDPLAVDVAPLAEVLDGPGLAVLHAAEQDLEVLERVCGTVPGKLFDTQVAAGFLGQVSASLVNLVERILGIRLLKGDQLTDWTRRPLSAGQLAYAAGDVAYLLVLRRVIGARLEEMGRSRWAAEEFAILLQKDRSPTEPDEAWWRLPRSRQLRGPARRGRPVRRRLAGAEGPADEPPGPFRLAGPRPALDRPAPAAQPRGSSANPKLGWPPSWRWRRRRAARRRHRGPEPPALGTSPPPAHDIDQPNRAVTTLATAFVAQRAGDLELDPAILATRADLVDFLQDPPQGRLAGGWRSELVGDGLRRLTQGQASLSFDGHGALLLEERSYRPLDHETGAGASGSALRISASSGPIRPR